MQARSCVNRSFKPIQNQIDQAVIATYANHSCSAVPVVIH